MKILQVTIALVIMALVHSAMLLPAPQSPSESVKPYTYQYGVEDSESKANFQASETKDAKGGVTGSYVVALPDGRIQTVKYSVDPVLGYVAEVSYSGKPVYPPVKAGQVPPEAIAPYIPVGYLG